MSIKIVFSPHERPGRLEYHFGAKWTLNDLYVAKQQADSILEESEEALAIVVNLLQSQQIPPNIITHCRIMITERNWKGRPVIVVTESSLVRSMLEIFRPTFQRRLQDLKCVRNLAEADAIIASCQSRAV